MTRPRFSIVAAVYNVKPYLDDFIASVERQRHPLDDIEVVMVDDGSTDGSRSVIDAWAQRRPDLVTVVGKENGGQASARNLGLRHVTGDWVTFSDPDDMLHPEFFARAHAFLAAHPSIELIAAKPLVVDELTGEIREHARSRQYAAGARVVSLDRDPNVFPGGTNITVFRVDRIREAGLRFDELLKPVFEDVHFTAGYLLALPAPVVGIVPGMRYLYRKRASNDSSLQQGWADTERYTTVLERGHLDLLRRSGDAPWVQSLVIYDLSWYLWEDERTGNRMRMTPEVRERFLELFEEILQHLDPAVVRQYHVRALKARWRLVLGQGARTRTWHAGVVAITKLDPAMRLQRAVVSFNGPMPEVRFWREGKPVEPAWSKVTSVRYFGEQWHSEYTAWIPARSGITATIDGARVRLGTRASARRLPNRPSPRAALGLVRGRLRGTRLEARDREWAERLRRRPRTLLAHTPLYRRYRDAWVLMDRADDGGDNAERLFEYLRRERPDVNAWFVVDGGTPGWRRLHARYGSRVVARGSFQWLMLMLNAAWLLTSHADEDVMAPPDVLESTVYRPYKVAFLQHGVTQQDLSRWLNRRDFEFAAATTEPELRSIVGDGSAYIYTGKEIRLTEMPRYDRLLRLGRAVPPAERRLVLIAPTWRKWLLLRKPAVDSSLTLDDSVWSSDYLQSWLAVVRSPRIAAAARERGLELVFLPHPNLARLAPSLDLPAGVRLASYAADDVQELLARIALMVTDYSSVAFDAAALDRPIVYFQFDHAQFFGGGHIGAAGYFEYARDGFGPVAHDVAGAEDAIVAAIEGGPQPSAEYQARIDASFPLRDGEACRRVVEAVEELSRPWRRQRQPAASAGRAAS